LFLTAGECGHPLVCHLATDLNNRRAAKKMANYGKCPLCKTQMMLCPGIGPYCPNKKCEVKDGADLYRSRPHKRRKVAKRATNKQMATALWNYLVQEFSVEEGVIYLTRKRLNSALKAVTKA